MTMPSSAVDGTDAPIDLPESPVIKRAAGISFGSANPRQPVDRPVPSEADVRVDTDTDTEPATASEPATQELVAE